MTWKDEDDRLMQRAWQIRQEISVTSDWEKSRSLQDMLKEAVWDIAVHRQCSIHEIHIRRAK